MMNRSSKPARPRLLRRIWPRRSALMRRIDWVEAAARLAVLTAVIVLLPVALTLGSETYASQVHAGEEQDRSRHQATATLVENAPATSMGAAVDNASSRSNVEARWTLPNGTERTGIIQAPDGLHTGAKVSIWLDEAGNATTEPITRDRAAAGGVAVAIGTWTIGTITLIGIYLVLHLWLNRHRAEGWRREWERVEPNWSRRSI